MHPILLTPRDLAVSASLLVLGGVLSVALVTADRGNAASDVAEPARVSTSTLYA
jgi:hypothetical protein